MSQTLFIQVFSTIFGMLIGSFLNVVIHRIPRDESVVTPPSACPQCSHVIKWYENIPVLSYIYLRGRCSQCKTSISIRYPLIELLMGIIAFLLSPPDASFHNLIIFIYSFSVASIFVSHFLIDLEHQLLPDKINLYFLIITLPYVYLFLPLTQSLVGGLIGFGGPYAITWLFWKLRGQIGLGGGDIKLFGILGLLFGPIGILNTIFLSCTLGALVGVVFIMLKKMDRQTALPFGPFILIIATIQFFFPDLAKYLNFFALSY